MNDTSNAQSGPNVIQAISAVAAEIGAVGKDQKMRAGAGGSYNYRGLDDLVDAVHPLLAKHGVVFAPHEIDILDSLEKKTRSGSVQYHLRALVTYIIHGPAGDHIRATVLAESADHGDKAGNKLMSAAYKYAIGQVLSVPYSMDDQDASATQHVYHEPQQQERPALDNETAIGVIAEAAGALGKSLADVTSRFRTDHGGISVEQLIDVDPQALSAFAYRVKDWADKNREQ